MSAYDESPLGYDDLSTIKTSIASTGTFDTNPFLAEPQVNSVSTSDALEEERKRLEARARELDQRERALKECEDELQELRLSRPKAPNWPCPCCCAIYHHQISLVPSASRCFVRVLYINWLLTSLTLLANWLVQLVLIVCGSMPENTKSFKLIIFSFFYALMGIPGSFRMWYWPNYCLLKDGEQPSVLKFNFVFFIHICFFVFGALGLQNWGFLGWFEVQSVSTSHVLLTYLTFAVACLWSLTVLVSIYVAVRSTRIFARALVYQELRNHRDLARHLIDN